MEPTGFSLSTVEYIRDHNIETKPEFADYYMKLQTTYFHLTDTLSK